MNGGGARLTLRRQMPSSLDIWGLDQVTSQDCPHSLRRTRSREGAQSAEGSQTAGDHTTSFLAGFGIQLAASLPPPVKHRVPPGAAGQVEAVPSLPTSLPQRPSPQGPWPSCNHPNPCPSTQHDAFFSPKVPAQPTLTPPPPSTSTGVQHQSRRHLLPSHLLSTVLRASLSAP